VSEVGDSVKGLIALIRESRTKASATCPCIDCSSSRAGLNLTASSLTVSSMAASASSDTLSSFAAKCEDLKGSVDFLSFFSPNEFPVTELPLEDTCLDPPTRLLGKKELLTKYGIINNMINTPFLSTIFLLYN